MGAFEDLLSSIGDSHIPGGCDLCDAYQTLEQAERGMHLLTIHHDDWCPELRAAEAGTN